MQPLDVLDALNSNNKMDVVGTYTWAAEEDTINSLSGGAEAVADIFETALNDTLAANVLPNGDTNALLGLIFDALFDNIGTPFNLILSNIPCLGLCDDVLGGAVYVGLGATGTLASLIDAAAASFTIPNIAIPRRGRPAGHPGRRALHHGRHQELLPGVHRCGRRSTPTASSPARPDRPNRTQFLTGDGPGASCAGTVPGPRSGASAGVPRYGDRRHPSAGRRPVVGANPPASVGGELGAPAPEGETIMRTTRSDVSRWSAWWQRSRCWGRRAPLQHRGCHQRR